MASVDVCFPAEGGSERLLEVQERRDRIEKPTHASQWTRSARQLLIVSQSHTVMQSLLRLNQVCVMFWFFCGFGPLPKAPPVRYAATDHCFGCWSIRGGALGFFFVASSKEGRRRWGPTSASCAPITNPQRLLQIMWPKCTLRRTNHSHICFHTNYEPPLLDYWPLRVVLNLRRRC